MTARPGIYSTPRGRSEDEWLDVAAGLVARLEAPASTGIQLGAYWGWCDGHSTSFNCRIRARAPFREVSSDAWEGALSVDGDERGTWADVSLFPFSRGSAVDERGRIADLGPDAEIDKFWWLQFESGAWRSRGWATPDDPGEWSWIRRPGDAYPEQLSCVAPPHPVRSGGPILAEIALDDRRFAEGETARARLSLLFAARGRRRLLAGAAMPPKTGSRRAIDIRDRWDARSRSARIDLQALSLRGGWQPGAYRLVLRLQLADDKGAWESRVSRPFSVEIE